MPEDRLAATLETSERARDLPSCAVLVMSCDAYGDLWRPFFTLFWRHWPGCPFPVYLGSNGANFDDSRVRTLAAGHREWGERVRLHLTAIPSDYVLLLLEDYFFTQPIDTEPILATLRLLKELNGTVLRLHPLPGPDKPVAHQVNIGRLDKRAAYRVSTQAAIWNKCRLLELLQNNESIWDFERRGSARSEEWPDGFYSTYRTVLPYRQVVERGEWFRSAARYFSGQQIGCDFSIRPVMSSSKTLKKAIVARVKNQLDRLLPPRWRFRV